MISLFYNYASKHRQNRNPGTADAGIQKTALVFETRVLHQLRVFGIFFNRRAGYFEIYRRPARKRTEINAAKFSG